MGMTAQRWQRRRHARTPEILAAALACFAQKGFAATRMDDIAVRAGISKGTIYLYFPSKEAVFEALARQEIGDRLAAVTERIETFQGSAADLLRMVLMLVGAMVRTGDGAVLPRMVLAEAGNFPELAAFWRREVIERGLGVFERIIRRGQAEGEFRPMPPQHAARLCVAPMLVVALWRGVFARFDTEPYDYEGLVAAHIDTLLRGLAAHGTADGVER